jgi:hypothetical protein
MKKLWKWLKRQFGMDKEFIAEMDAMVGRAEMTFLDKIEGTPIMSDHSLIVDMLAHRSFDENVRARAMMILRTGLFVGMNDFCALQKRMAETDAGYKKQILKALEHGQCKQPELRGRLVVKSNNKTVFDHCLSLCMELAREGKVVEETNGWRLADQYQAKTAQEKSG